MCFRNQNSGATFFQALSSCKLQQICWCGDGIPMPLFGSWKFSLDFLVPCFGCTSITSFERDITSLILFLYMLSRKLCSGGQLAPIDSSGKMELIFLCTKGTNINSWLILASNLMFDYFPLWTSQVAVDSICVPAETFFPSLVFF